MRLLPTVIAAVALTAVTAPSAFAMDKMDGDAWLKAIFHGKPGEIRADIVHGHHHYNSPVEGRRSFCVDHTGWAPISIEALVGLTGDSKRA